MAKDKKDILINDDDLENREDTLIIFVFFYAVFVLLLMTGHAGWLMYEHHQLLESFGINPSPQTYIDGMPTFVTWILMVLMFLLAPCCNACLSDEESEDGESEDEDDKCANCLVVAALIFVTSAALNVLMYTIQIIVYLSKDVRYYLDSLPQTAECHCHNETDPLLYNISQQLYTCRCILPLEQCAQTLVTTDMDLLDDSTLEGKGLFDTGEVITQYHNSSNLVNAALDFSSSTVTMMFILAQISIVIIVIRFPLWIAVQEIAVLNEEMKRREELKRVAMTSTGDVPSARNRFQRNVQIVVKRINIQKEFATMKKMNIHFAIELCFYGFIEGVDAFSLLDEFLENGGYFAANKPLADTVLAFISINLLVVNLSNMLACIPRQTERINHATKMTVILISNVPFLIIRSYLFWLFGGLNNSDLSSIFLLFVIKEAMVVLLTVVEVAVEVYHDKKKRQQVAPVTD